jgi:DNA polymerase-3 subunit epsilon
VLHARSGIVRSLDRIRAEGRELDLVELAQRLLRVSAPLERPLARRLLAAALECSPEALPERLTLTDQMAARHGVLRSPSPKRDRSGLAVLLPRATFTVVDLETTGLSERCSIVEIGAVRVEALRVTARFETLVDPGGEVPVAVRELTGIDERVLEDAPAPREALSALRSWLAATPEAVFVAHNVAFDAGFLRRALSEHGMPGLRAPLLCTCKLGRRVLPRLRAYNLDALCAQFGISNRARHRALGDAEATARLLIELLALVRTEDPAATLLDLLELQQRPLRRRRSTRRR